MEKRYIEVNQEKARELYCNCERVFVTNDRRTLWKLPASYEYGSNAPASELFHRSIPEYEGENKFFILEKPRRKYVCYYINSRGNQISKVFDDIETGVEFTRILDSRIARGTCFGYNFHEL